MLPEAPQITILITDLITCVVISLDLPSELWRELILEFLHIVSRLRDMKIGRKIKVTDIAFRISRLKLLWIERSVGLLKTI